MQSRSCLSHVCLLPDLPQVDVLHSVTTSEFSDAVLQCSVTGSPTPEIRWLRNGTYVPSADGILALENVSRSDRDVYTCEATNLAGRATGSTTLDVLCKYRFILV